MQDRTPGSEKNIMTSDEVAAYLSVCEETVKRMAREKRIPSFKVGRLWRFRRDQVVEWTKALSERSFSE